MLLRAYAIFDSKSLIYNSPFFAPTDGAAVRMLTDLVSDPNTTVGRHPADYVLFCIGGYDDQKGQLLPFIPLEHIVDAVALVKTTAPFDFQAPLSQKNG